MRVFYFGFLPGSGHFLQVPSGRTAGRDQERALPFAWHILDAALLPQDGPEDEGRVYRSLINGWTVLAFWDRSGDSRGKSNSSFILEGEHTIEAGLALAREMYPRIFARFTFELKAA